MENIPYGSDNDAVSFRISLKKEEGIELETSEEKRRYNFKKTDWKKFAEYLQSDNIIEIVNDRNLSVEEINEYLEILDERILAEAMEKSIPKIKKRNSVSTL